ncbi:MAG: UbiH/UbiF/VisC/COQ6 family ubiquinone biosynthesis hydroxylase [Alphaproteobacteria bacterium]
MVAVAVERNDSDKGMGEREAADLVIIGGGFTGLTLACAVAGAGLSVVVIDRQRPEDLLEARFDGRTSAIAYGSEQVLSAIGAWPRLAGVAEPILDIRVSDRGSPLFLHYDHRELPGVKSFGHMVENRHIRRALFEQVEACPGARLVSGVAVARLERGPAGVEVTLSSGPRVRARLAVAADGRESDTRRAAGIPVTRWSYRQVGIVCTVAHERPHRGVAHERFLSGGPFAILPMTGRRSAIVWTEKADLARNILALDETAFMDELRRRFGDFLGEVEPAGPRWSYPLALVHARRYVDQRLALIGDAAHAIHPIAGQGLNLGLRDAAALAEVVVDAGRLGLDIGDPLQLERYERWRRFDSFVLIAATDGLNRLFANDVRPVRMIRDLGLAAVNRMPPLKRLFMRHAMGITGNLPRLVQGRPL